MSTYNTEPKLWHNYAKHCRQLGERYYNITIDDGHIMDGTEAIGRFESDAHAETTLTGAGFVKGEDGKWRVRE